MLPSFSASSNQIASSAASPEPDQAERLAPQRGDQRPVPAPGAHERVVDGDPAGEAEDPAVTRGINFLTRTQGADGFWNEERYTATGFPRVFYLRYHGYPKFFPLWAMARFRNLKKGNSRQVQFGM